MKAEILSTHTPELFKAAVARAVELLQAGEVVALPTETVYGLAANAFDARAVSRIFEIKGRPSHNPIIVHAAGMEMVERCVSDWPPIAEKLARAFWPGPLTLVLPRAAQIPDVVTAGGRTVGVRWPGHPFMQSVLQQCGFPLAAPSANLANQVSPTNAEHVRKQLGDKIPLIVDGGQSQVGIESTVLDVGIVPPRVLRPGMIHENALLSVVTNLTIGDRDKDNILKSPGLMPRHYAPKAKLMTAVWKDEHALKVKLAAQGVALAKSHIIAHTHIPSQSGFGRVSVIPHDAEAFARAIYAELHRCDELGAQTIVIETLPDTIEWRAINDRLKRAMSD
ncbi:MAG TPA: L-threonylcarbamoyladenylate synthase [Verrucomicrobiae bacterium]|nr:L-threonylcarbamoyladenylate synthase [Verrucomicrobiae bacterium]